MDHYRNAAYLRAMDLITTGEESFACLALYRALCEVTGMKETTAGADEFIASPDEFSEFFVLYDSTFFNPFGCLAPAMPPDAWWASPWSSPRLRALALALERSR